jgi:cytochrome b subunit of formate dehydrogenase
MWYDFVPKCMFVVGILMLSFGVWGIVCWDQYSKLLANINLLTNKLLYNVKERRIR